MLDTEHRDPSSARIGAGKMGALSDKRLFAEISEDWQR
jgi:hypothetical protein